VIKGLPELIKYLEGIKTEIPHDAESVLQEIAEEIMVVAQERTPVVSGNLQKSGKVGKAYTTGNVTQVILSFGNDLVDYPIYVHENLKAVHPNGQAKFLESAVLDSASYVGEKISYRMMNIWRRI
jgi:hypothetical protein